MSAENPKVNFFFEKPGQWQDAFVELRKIVLSKKLNEELKWGVPCYTYQNSNIVLIHGFKDYCALLFHKGVLLSDPNQVLIQQTKNVQAARQLRFTSAQQISEMRAEIKKMIEEAIAVEQSGQKVELKKTADFEMPEEFRLALDENTELKSAFKNLTPGRQRAYLLHFSQAKQPKTRLSRIEKHWDRILAGKGLLDD